MYRFSSTLMKLSFMYHLNRLLPEILSGPALSWNPVLAALMNGCYITTLNLMMIRERYWFSTLSTVPLPPPPPPEEIRVATASVRSSDSAKNTGVVLASTFSFDKHVTQICRS